MAKKKLKYVSSSYIDKVGRVNLGPLIDGYSNVSLYVWEPDADRIRILPINDPENYYSGGVRSVDHKRRIMLPRAMRGNAKRVLIAQDGEELVLWLQFD